jgi:hypothetical protein
MGRAEKAVQWTTRVSRVISCCLLDGVFVGNCWGSFGSYRLVDRYLMF